MLRQGISHVRKFDENISQLIPFVAPGNTVTLFTFQVPSKSALRLTKFANYTDTPAAVGAISWSIKRNGIGINPYDNILDIIGQSYQPEEIEIDELRGADVLTITVTNGHVAIVQMGIRVKFELGENE